MNAPFSTFNRDYGCENKLEKKNETRKPKTNLEIEKKKKLSILTLYIHFTYPICRLCSYAIFLPNKVREWTVNIKIFLYFLYHSFYHLFSSLLLLAQ